MEPDIDKLLRRRLSLQRYVTSLYKEVIRANASSDRRLIQQLSLFVLDADDKTLAALSRLRTGNPEVNALLAGVREIVKEQQANTMALISGDVSELVEQEARVTAAAIGASTPSTQGVATLPVAGLAVGAIIAAAYERYATRLRAEIVQAAATNPRDITAIVRGTRAQNYRDGLQWWRDNNLVRTNVDMIVNGVAANAAEHVYRTAGVKMLNHTATLDFRVCLQCAAYESGGPYEVGTQPRLPVHPNCRCLNTPATDESPVRPQVRDSRSVKDIPVAERAGRIRQGRDTMEQFFNRMSKRERIEAMGPARAALWEAGKVTDIRGFVNQITGEPLRLDQLPTL